MPNIREIDPEKNELTLEIISKLRNVTIPSPTKNGNWSTPLPPMPTSGDSSRPTSSFYGIIHPHFRYPEIVRRVCGNYFPAGGGIGWHTDSRMPGLRLYAFLHLGEGGSMMRYRDQHFVEGKKGAYLFETGPDCWHAIEAFDRRLSSGFHIPVEFAETLI